MPGGSWGASVPGRGCTPGPDAAGPRCCREAYASEPRLARLIHPQGGLHLIPELAVKECVLSRFMPHSPSHDTRGNRQPLRQGYNGSWCSHCCYRPIPSRDQALFGQRIGLLFTLIATLRIQIIQIPALIAIHMQGDVCQLVHQGKPEVIQSVVTQG